MKLLEVRNLSKYFGGLLALIDVDLDVYRGEILGIIGPNGAGKTTLYNVITGMYQRTAGTVNFKGEDLINQRPSKIAAKGLVRTWQAASIFTDMTVMENMLTACTLQSNSGFLHSILRTTLFRREQEHNKKRAVEILEVMGLTEVKDSPANSLPHGNQKSLGVAMALVSNPELLLLDEPTTGMNPEESSAMMDLIKKIQKMGATLVIIEHDMEVVMCICDRIVVLNFGRKIAEGTPREIQNNKKVIECYLGGG